MKERMTQRNNKTVLLGVTGGIAAYKAAELTSRLKKAGFEVLVIMTEHATHFVSALTFETLSGNPVAVDMFDRHKPWEVEHISWAKRADIMVIAPASANFIGKYTHGIADDMLTTTAMAFNKSVVIAPAMNTAMYMSPATQSNIACLTQRGVCFIGPEGGKLACGDTGIGRMSEPADIEAYVKLVLGREADMKGMRLLVTCGGTRENIDPVRFITNRSSGRMGTAIAEAALERGAEVHMVCAAMSVEPPLGAQVTRVGSTMEMLEACEKLFPACDAAIMAAAPADYRVEQSAEHKLKKTGEALTLRLVENPDIAKALGERKKPGQKLVIFAAETEELLKNAQSKLERKAADMVVANDVSQKDAGFDVDTNRIHILTRKGESEKYPLMSKRETADVILNAMLGLV